MRALQWLHLLFARHGFCPRVQAWAADTRAMLLDPGRMLAPFGGQPES